MKNIDIKKIIIVLIILLIGALAYLLFFNKKNTSTNELTTFFPFDEEAGSNSNNGLITSVYENPYNESPTEPLPVLRQITDSPIAGMIIFKEELEESEEEINYIIRYIEKATGHVYEANTNSLTQTRISNTTIPKIQEAIWLDKESLIIRYLDDNNIIKTFSAELTENELGDKQLEGIFLQDDIKNLISFNNGIFYLLESGGGSIGVTSDKDDNNKKIVFESPLKEWLIKNINDRYINLTTKPAITTSGYSFLLDTKTGSFDKVINDKNNLSTLTSSLFNILYSEYNKFGPRLSIYSNEEKISSEISIKTFPEKCVWDEKNTYIYCGVPLEGLSNSDLTNWYKGKISFSDNIWKIDVKTNNLEYLVSPTELEVGSIDIINPILSENNNYFLFINKKDFSLWSLRLKKEF